MKSLLFAAVAAFGFVTPAAAQPAAQHPPEHAAHQDHAQHGGHAAHGQGQGAEASRAGHAMGDCCADRNGNGRMDCCEGAEAAACPCCAGHAERAPARQAQPQPR